MKIEEHARQLVGHVAVPREPITLVSLKFCVDVEWLDLTVTLGFIDGFTIVGDVIEVALQAYLESKSGVFKEVLTLDKVDYTVQRDLRISMRDANATLWIQNLFVNYHSILRRQGLF